MGVDINWGLLRPGEASQNALATGLQLGQQFREAQDRREQRNALTAYAKDPDAPGAMNALLPHLRPDQAFAAIQDQREQARKVQERQLIGDALANPDPALRSQARQRLAYANHEEYQKLGADQKKQVDATMGEVAQQAFHILQMPAEQQGPALQQALQAMHARGMDLSGVDMSHGPEQTLLSALAVTGHLDEWEQFAKPSYTPVGERGLAGFQFGKPIADANGSPRDFGAIPPPPPGFKLDGGSAAAPRTPFDQAFQAGIP